MSEIDTPPQQDAAKIISVEPTVKQTVDFQKIIDQNAHPDPGLTPEEQAKFIHRYSFAALIWQFIYYFAMGDGLLAWLSIFCSVVFIFSPLLLILPFWARRRAYDSHEWSGFPEYYSVQKKWDRSAVYITIIGFVLGALSFWILGPTLLNAIRAVTGNSNPDASFTQQLQDTVKQYQNVLGQ